MSVCVHLPLSLQAGPELFQLLGGRGSLVLVLTLVTRTSVPSLCGRHPRSGPGAQLQKSWGVQRWGEGGRAWEPPPWDPSALCFLEQPCRSRGLWCLSFSLELSPLKPGSVQHS